jgi:tRNA pseudouridine38-40 synthase
MVRTIVGTLARVGSGELTGGDVAAILAGRDRTRAGATAPPHGLVLVNVRYG